MLGEDNNVEKTVVSCGNSVSKDVLASFYFLRRIKFLYPNNHENTLANAKDGI